MTQGHQVVELWPAEPPTPIMHAVVCVHQHGEVGLMFYQRGELDKAYRLPAAAARALAALIVSTAAEAEQ